MPNYQPQILQILLAQNAHAPLQALSRDDLARQLGVTWAELRPDVTYLHETGLLVFKTRHIGTSLFHSLHLTPKGIAWLEGQLLDPTAPAPVIASDYNLRNIRTLLNEGFTDAELRRLCYDEPKFRPVYDELAQETGKAKIIDTCLNTPSESYSLTTCWLWSGNLILTGMKNTNLTKIPIYPDD